MRRRRPRKLVNSSVLNRWPSPNGLGRSGVRLVTLTLIAMSLWLLTSFVGQVVTSAQMDRRAAELRAELYELEGEQAKLETAVAYAESPAYAEKVGREQFGYAREGDTVIMPTLPQLSPEPVEPTAAPLPPPPSEPNWRAWSRALFP